MNNLILRFYTTLKTIKYILCNFKVVKTVLNNVDIIDICHDILMFLEIVADSGEPHSTRICGANIKTRKGVFNVVTLWAGVGFGNAIDRSFELRKQRDRLMACVRELCEEDVYLDYAKRTEMSAMVDGMK